MLCPIYHTTTTVVFESPNVCDCSSSYLKTKKCLHEISCLKRPSVHIKNIILIKQLCNRNVHDFAMA